MNTMNKIEKTLTSLRELGFFVETIGDDLGYKFEFEGINYFIANEDTEADDITISVPGVYDIPEDGRTEALEAMNTLCGKVKFIQPVIMFDNQVWLNYQHHLGEADPTTETVEHMIRALAFGTAIFHQITSENEEDDD